MRTVRFSYNLISLPASLDLGIGSSKVTLKDDPYERQPRKTAEACAPIV